MIEQKSALGALVAPQIPIREEAESHMYKSPELKKLGTFRDVTKAGNVGPTDGALVHGDGCAFNARCS